MCSAPVTVRRCVSLDLCYCKQHDSSGRGSGKVCVCGGGEKTVRRPGLSEVGDQGRQRSYVAEAEDRLLRAQPRVVSQDQL